jgi:hypothetical protein
MEEIYTAIMARLKEQVTELKWIDLDEGQLEYYADRPSVAFPCVLIDIALTRCEDLYPGAQLCHATIGIRIARHIPTSRTNSVATETVRGTALERYRLAEKVYEALQSWESGLFNPLSRTAQKKETRKDSLFVTRIDFSTQFKQKI